MQYGPWRTTREGGREPEGFIYARFQIIHFTEMLRRDFLAPRVESVNLRPEPFELLHIL